MAVIPNTWTEKKKPIKIVKDEAKSKPSPVTLYRANHVRTLRGVRK